MLALNTKDADIGNGTSYKKLTEILQGHLDIFKGDIIEKNKVICNLTSAMKKNLSTP